MNAPLSNVNLPHPKREAFYPPDRGYSHALLTYQRLSTFFSTFQSTYNSAGQGVGPTIASADTITVTAEIHHVTGTASIRQIDLGAQQFSGPIVLIADGAWQLVTGGNISVGARPEVGTHIQVVLDNLTSPQIWYPITGLSGRDFIDNEIPNGAVDGSNATFTLANTPIAGTVQLYRNGIRQTVGSDFTISGATITFNSPPDSGDSLLVDYRI